MMKIQNNNQILLVGKSHGHIYEVIEKFHPSKVALISSENLKKSSLELMKNLNSKNIMVDIHFVHPFTQNAIKEIYLTITSIGKKFLKNYPNSNLFIGLTGGTNLMAIAAGLSALSLKCKSHYVFENNGKISFFDFQDYLPQSLNLFGLDSFTNKNKN